MAVKPGAAIPIPAGLNWSLAAAHFSLNLYFFFALPIYVLSAGWWWGASALAVAALSNSLWSLLHEAIHDNFHPSGPINAWAGRALGIVFGAPFRVLRVTHLAHHGLNRSPIEGTELYDPANTSWVRAGAGYFFHILGGLYLLEALSSVFFLSPYRALMRCRRKAEANGSLAGIVLGVLTREDSLGEIRRDGMIVIALLAASFWCYGRFWPWLAGGLAVRAFLISFLDNVYHYRTRLDDMLYAENLRLPRWLAAVLLHFNLHGVHHRNTAIPWVGLPEAFGAQALAYDGSYFAAVARQLRGPISLGEFSSLPK